MDFHYTVFIVELLSELMEQTNGDTEQTEPVHGMTDMSTHCLIVGSITHVMSVSPEPFLFLLREKDRRYKKLVTTDLQNHRQKFVFFAELNNLAHFMKFRYLSHMRKVKL